MFVRRHSLAAILLLTGSAGLLPAGCASTMPEANRAAEQERTIEQLRLQNTAYKRQVEELENRVFILSDRAESQNINAERVAAPQLPPLPTVRLVREGQAPAPEQTYRRGSAANPVTEISDNANQFEPAASVVAQSDVEYGGEAAQRARGKRPVLRLTGEGEAGQVREELPRETPLAAALAENDAKSTDDSTASANTEKRPPLRAGLDAREARARNRRLPLASEAAAAPVKKVASVEPPVAAAKTTAPTPAPAIAAPPAKAAVARTPAPAVAEAPAPPPKAAVADDPTPSLTLYRQALDALRAGDHKAAVEKFRHFVAKHPSHDYADNAQYWLGECFYDQKNYGEAIVEFRTVVEKFAGGNKVPDALLKMGFSHLLRGESAVGKAVLAELVRTYPKHAVTSLASAKLAEIAKAPQ